MQLHVCIAKRLSKGLLAGRTVDASGSEILPLDLPLWSTEIGWGVFGQQGRSVAREYNPIRETLSIEEGTPGRPEAKRLRTEAEESREKERSLGIKSAE